MASHVFGTENTVVNKADKYTCSCGAYILVGKRCNKQVKKYNTECKRKICKMCKEKKTKQKQERDPGRKRERGAALKFRLGGFRRSL